MKLTTDRALKFSAVLLLVYTITCMIFQWFDKPIDATLTASVFVAFGVAEGGYCAYIHKLKKEKPLTTGDITGYDDAEIMDEDESDDQSN